MAVRPVAYNDQQGGCINKGHWSFTAYAENLTNANVAVFTGTDQFIVAQTPRRLQVLGAKFGYRF